MGKTIFKINLWARKKIIIASSHNTLAVQISWRQQVRFLVLKTDNMCVKKKRNKFVMSQFKI